MSKKYVYARENSLEEIKRIYTYLNGSSKNFESFKNKVKEKYPEAKKEVGKNTQWHFDIDKIWEDFKSNERFNKALETRRIKDYQELSLRSFEFEQECRM